jgi:hypothetical protein
MPFNGSGIFTLVYNWPADAAAGIDIMASRMQGQESDMASSGFDNCLTRDGQGSATTNLPMNNYRHTGVGNGQAATDYAALGQVQFGTSNWVVATGTSDAIVATYSPVITAIFDGQLCFFRATAPNATTTPTFAPNGLTAEVITKTGGNPLFAGDIPGALAECILRYNSANTRWELLNPAQRSLRTAVNDAAYSMKGSDSIIAYTAISAARAVALLSAAAFGSGSRVTVVDESGSASATNTITLNRNGSDTINGATSAVIKAAYGFIVIESNGSNAWTIIGEDFNSQFGNLPTSLPVSSGILWNNGGVVSIS